VCLECEIHRGAVSRIWIGISQAFGRNLAFAREGVHDAELPERLVSYHFSLDENGED
jgi:hypothetical protein